MFVNRGRGQLTRTQPGTEPMFYSCRTLKKQNLSQCFVRSRHAALNFGSTLLHACALHSWGVRERVRTAIWQTIWNFKLSSDLLIRNERMRNNDARGRYKNKLLLSPTLHAKTEGWNSTFCISSGRVAEAQVEMTHNNTCMWAASLLPLVKYII